MITKKCAECRKEYEIFKYRAESSRFCSKECMLKHHQIEIACEYCGLKFKRGKAAIKEHNYCSTACMLADPKHRERLSEAIKKTDNPTWNRNWQHINKGKRRSPNTEFKKGWQHTEKGREIIKKRLKSIHKTPNKREEALIKLIRAIELPYEYVGDGSFLVGSKNPDFIRVDGEKAIIELYGEYWHDPKNCKYWHQTEEGAKTYYQYYGFDLLVVWECELDNPEVLSRKLLEFTGESLQLKTNPKTIQIFEDFAEEQFMGNKGFALKWLVDNVLVEDPKITQMYALLEDVDQRLSMLEKKKVEKPERFKKMLSGKKIVLPDQE